MPNWCENELTVEGSPEKVSQFKAWARGEGDEVLDANKIIPYPRHLKLLDLLTPWLGEPPTNEAELRAELARLVTEGALEGYDLSRDGFNQGGYEWCHEKWGTKWGFCNPRISEEENGYILYEFDTAWSPPVPLIKKMAEKFPELRFELRYFECGAGFHGILVLEGGQVETDRRAEYFGHRGG